MDYILLLSLLSPIIYFGFIMPLCYIILGNIFPVFIIVTIHLIYLIKKYYFNQLGDS